MQDDETTLPPEEYTEEAVVEETTEVVEEAPKAEEVTLSPAEYRHFKKWQSEKDKPAPRVEVPQASPSNVEETVLLAQGLPEELLTELKAVATVRKVSLIKAQTDPIFVAVKEKFERDQKREDASLPASRGSGGVKPKKDFGTSGLSREEHMAMFNKHN